MVMSHNLHTNLGNWCIFPENKLIYQGKWLKPQIVSGGEIITFSSGESECLSLQEEGGHLYHFPFSWCMQEKTSVCKAIATIA